MPTNRNDAGAKPATNKRVLLSATACLGIACATILGDFIPQWESSGRQILVPYRDIAGVWTVCDGDTANVTPGRSETAEGCSLRLDTRLAREFGPAVLKCAPGLKDHPEPLAAAVSLAWNIGAKNFCGSTAARRFKAGDLAGGCAAFLSWNKARVRGQLVAVTGLTRRRVAERDLCLKGVN